MPTHSRDSNQMAQPKRKRGDSVGVKKRKTQHPIDWSTWWPFTRATGEALKQLNRRQPKKQLDDYEEAPL